MRFLTPRGLAGLGWGLPLALGAKAAAPRRQVIALVGDAYGIDAWREVSTTFMDAFPNWHVEIEDIVTSDDKGAARLHWTGTLAREFQGTAPDGQTVDIQGQEFYTFRDGKLSGHWTAFDTLTFLRQLGALANS